MKKRLMSIAVMHGDDIKSIGRLLGVSYPTIWNKVSGKRNFLDKEIAILAEKYNLSGEQIVDIFLRRYFRDGEGSCETFEEK